MNSLFSISALNALFKFRLSSLVVFSSVVGFLVARGGFWSWAEITWLSLGGILVTGASNGLNQVLELEQDRLMNRTRQRPIPSGQWSRSQALMISVFSGMAGLAVLALFFNWMAAGLSLFSLVLYAFIYTPLKPITPLAVLVGAFPGAFPPLIGWAAANGDLTQDAWVLFTLQFVWQFPHFWTLAWILHEDYSKGGYQLLPSKTGRTRNSAFQMFLYTALLLPVSVLPFRAGLMKFWAVYPILACGLVLLYLAWQHYRRMELTSARNFMWGGFLYLPIVYIFLLIALN